MGRIPFSQVLKNASIDIRKEYDRLYELFFLAQYLTISSRWITLRGCCDCNFVNLHFRGTCVSLDDFDAFYGYHFEKMPRKFDINYLVSFCEYSYNLVINSQEYIIKVLCSHINSDLARSLRFYIQQMMKVIEEIGYMLNTQNGISDLVPKSQEAIAVAEIVDPNLSYKVIEYNHHSMKGDLEKKRDTLLALADQLEPKRPDLKKINSDLESDLFFLYNNVNIRHNNSDPNGTKYKQVVAAMTDQKIEKWYDDAYQMSLLAFLELDNVEREERVQNLRDAFKNSKNNI